MFFMSSPHNLLFLKKAVARRAFGFLEEDMVVGIGSGSTVRELIKILAENKVGVRCVPTSLDTELMLHRYRLKVEDPNSVDRIDIAIDGADSVLPDKKVILKGGGGALTREKIVDYYAERFVVIADYTKVNRFFPIVVEVLPFAFSFAIKNLKRFGEPNIRYAANKLGPVITDNGNILVDLRVDVAKISRELERRINSIPGIVENGIFSRDTIVLVANKDGAIEEIQI